MRGRSISIGLSICPAHPTTATLEHFLRSMTIWLERRPNSDVWAFLFLWIVHLPGVKNKTIYFLGSNYSNVQIIFGNGKQPFIIFEFCY